MIIFRVLDWILDRDVEELCGLLLIGCFVAIGICMVIRAVL